METLTIDLKKKKSFEIGQQGDHNALCIHFINMKNVGTNKKYIYYTIDGIENCVPLTNDRFIIGYPLTAHSGIASAQLISKLNDNSIIKLSNVFAMHIKESKGYKDSGEYPVDPNIQSSYDLLDDLINETKDLINNYNYATLMEKLTQASSEATTSAATAKKCADELKDSTDFINTLDEKVAAQDSKIEKIEASTSHITTKQNTKIAALQTRMSEFTSLKDGSTTGDAELIDARIGADGTKYSSAGDAMRAQVEQLNDDLTHYIYKPTLEDNNKFPRAKDGNVEWVEQGMPTDEQTSNAINNWLNAHPEATTTVLDESLTESKFTNDLKLHTLKDYITPQMFGAKGDGITDDTKAFQKCFDANKKIIIPKGNYLVGRCEVTNECLIEMYDGAYITLKDEYFMHTSEGVITITGGRFYGTAKAQESRYYAKKVITGKLFDIKITNTRFYQCIALYQTEGNYSGFIHCNNMWVYDSQFIISTKTLNFVSCVGCVIQNASNIIEASNYENVSLVNCSIEHVINLFSPTYDGVSYNGISITNCYIEYSSLFTTGKCTSIEVRNSWIYTDVTLIALNSGPGYCVISNNSITLLNETKLINNTNISTLLEFGVGSIKYNNGTIDRNNVNNIYSGTCFVKVLNQETLYMNSTCDTLLFTGKQNTTVKKSISVNGEEDKIYYRPETSGLKASTFIPYILKLGKSDLLSITPPKDCFAIELTTKILYIYDGTNWRKASDGSILE